MTLKTSAIKICLSKLRVRELHGYTALLYFVSTVPQFRLRIKFVIILHVLNYHRIYFFFVFYHVLIVSIASLRMRFSIISSDSWPRDDDVTSCRAFSQWCNIFALFGSISEVRRVVGPSLKSQSFQLLHNSWFRSGVLRLIIEADCSSSTRPMQLKIGIWSCLTIMSPCRAILISHNTKRLSFQTRLSRRLP